MGYPVISIQSVLSSSLALSGQFLQPHFATKAFLGVQGTWYLQSLRRSLDLRCKREQRSEGSMPALDAFALSTSCFKTILCHWRLIFQYHPLPVFSSPLSFLSRHTQAAQREPIGTAYLLPVSLSFDEQSGPLRNSAPHPDYSKPNHYRRSRCISKSLLMDTKSATSIGNFEHVILAWDGQQFLP